MRKNAAISVLISLLVVAGVFSLVRSGGRSGGGKPPADAVRATMVGDTQVIEITARGGYSPRSIVAKAGVPTVIKVTTKDTYDCSVALTIPKLQYRQFLGPTGTTEIPITPEQATGTLRGLCSMGMYSFSIDFE